MAFIEIERPREHRPSKIGNVNTFAWIGPTVKRAFERVRYLERLDQIAKR